MESRGRTDAEDAGHLDLERVRQLFDASTDFTIGLEEEFAIVDPESLDLRHRFEDLYAACLQDELLAESAAGELIASEIEIRSGRAESFARAMQLQREHRARLFALAEGMGLALAATGTHPWANYLDQRIIDTPHYARLREELRWVAQRNNTWSLHVHVGVRGADRAVAVCDHLRGVLPALLALSANSPFLDGRDTGPQLGAHRDLHAHLSALRDPRAVRELEGLPGFHRRSWSAPGRSSRRPSFGGACALTTPSARSRCGSATRRPEGRSRSRSRR